MCILFKTSWFDFYMSISMCIHLERFLAWHNLEIQFISSSVCSLRWWRLPYWKNKRILFFVILKCAEYAQVFFFLLTRVNFHINKKQEIFFNEVKSWSCCHYSIGKIHRNFNVKNLIRKVFMTKIENLWEIIYIYICMLTI